MAVDAITGVERNRDVIEHNRDVLERRRLERLASDRLRLQRERAARLDAEGIAQRAQLRDTAERTRLEELDYARQAQRIEARRQDELDRIELRDQRTAANALANLEAERARIVGIEAYRAQIERLQVTALPDNFAVDRVQAEAATTLRAQIEAPRIDQVDLSDFARARLEGILGAELIGNA